MTVTYEAIASYTVSGSSASSYTFNPIPSTYTDIYIVAQIQTLPSGGSFNMRVNSDSGTNYSATRMYGNGSTATSDRVTSQTYLVSFGASTLNPVNFNIHLQNYSNSTTFKTALTRLTNAGEFVAALVGLWRSTSAITSITFDAGSTNFPVGSTFSLYGIKAE